ncbi:hypothetical protein GLAREA_03981 [Glarea lozoyensis ATCC 20868]|uniref:Uncharacterized protein n=1 Tax=Glarea lozoyensis (strain ATCC 20868 / MF5171) TaxID=1116229 RepID=S3D1H1_GLAL2|nr:uncharacterized protein GLAREA_03981 [Glarea lozoyensis ATCC 20868]EPE31014.1 hypothetical protein GLAREA_03981 [Glarea lozoyensis ATCC 20868]
MLTTNLLASSQVGLPRVPVAAATSRLRSSKIIRPRVRSQQSRAFKFGPWSSYLDPTYQKELKHRNRLAAHKYMEALNRKLLWDERRLPNYGKHFGLKSFMCSAWNHRNPQPHARWANLDINGFDGEPPSAPERGIEDVEQSALDHLLNSKNFPNAADNDTLNSSNSRRRIYNLNHARQEVTKSDRSKTNTRLREEKGITSENQAYEIDPITNRRVYKNSTAHETENFRKSIHVPVKTFKGYRFHFQDFNPPWDNATKPRLAAEKSAPSKNAQNSNDFRSINLESQNAQVNKARIRPTPSTNLRSSQRTTTTQLSDDGYGIYDAKVSYNKPFMAYEPDGQIEPNLKSSRKGTATEVNDDGYGIYDAKVSYNEPFMAYEPDGQVETHDKPDRPRSHDEVSKVTQKIKRPFNGRTSSPKAVLDQMLFKFDKEVAQSAQPQTSVSSKSTREASDYGYGIYDSKVSYDQPFMAYEPDGQMPHEEMQDPVEKCLNDYDSRHPYGAVYHNEPDGQPCENIKDAMAAYDKEHPYGPVYHNEPDGNIQPRDPVAEGLRDYDSRISYSPRPSAQQTKYQKLFRYIEEPEPVARSSLEEAKAEPNAADIREIYRHPGFKARNLDKNSTGNSNRKGKVSSKSSDPEGKRTPSPAPEKKLTGNFVRDFPEESSVRWDSGMSGTASLLPEKLNYEGIESDKANADKQTISGGASQELFSRIPNTPRLETSLERNSTTKLAATTTRNQENPDLKSSMQGEGDLSTSISSCLKSAAEAASSNPSLKGNKESIEPSSMKPSSKTNSDAADNTATAPSSPLTQDEVQRTLEEIFHKVSFEYKVLAYDPATQMVAVGDTTSKGNVMSQPLNIAEVIPRLSQPARFFPYFEKLAMEGYDIDSGSGDVLIFRKVRPSIIPQREKHLLRNPIDGMGPFPATGNFASPTGFVNYDSYDGASDNKWNDVQNDRVQEPVSGKKNWEEEAFQGKKKKSKGRKLLIGAASIGACTYAVGVVAEYFRSGGLNGRGPVGL